MRGDLGLLLLFVSMNFRDRFTFNINTSINVKLEPFFAPHQFRINPENGENLQDTFRRSVRKEEFWPRTTSKINRPGTTGLSQPIFRLESDYPCWKSIRSGLSNGSCRLFSDPGYQSEFRSFRLRLLSTNRVSLFPIRN